MNLFSKTILIFLLSHLAIAGEKFSPEDIRDIAEMVQREDGLFDVICVDGSEETVSADDIRAGQVCLRSDYFILTMGVYWSKDNSDPGRVIIPDYDDHGHLLGFKHHPIREYSGKLCYDSSFVGHYKCDKGTCTTSYSTIYKVSGRNQLQRNSTTVFEFSPDTPVESMNWCN